MVESRWDMMHSELHAAAFILNPRYHDCHDFSGDAMADHGMLVMKWLDPDLILTYKEQFSLYKHKDGVFASKDDLMFKKAALTAGPHAWWDYWGSGKKVLHDFAVRVQGQPQWEATMEWHHCTLHVILCCLIHTMF